MSLTTILALAMAALLVLTVYLAVQSLRAGNWKKAVLTVLLLAALVTLLYFGLVSFITSM